MLFSGFSSPLTPC